MAARSYLALDLGVESGRAALGQFDGERLVCAEVHRFANQPVVAEVAVLAQPATAWIEPDAAEFGRQYIELTRRYTDIFKGVAPGL